MPHHYMNPRTHKTVNYTQCPIKAVINQSIKYTPRPPEPIIHGLTARTSLDPLCCMLLSGPYVLLPEPMCYCLPPCDALFSGMSLVPPYQLLMRFKSTPYQHSPPQGTRSGASMCGWVMTWGGSPFFTCTRDSGKPPARRGGGGPAGHILQQQEQLQPAVMTVSGGLEEGGLADARVPSSGSLDQRVADVDHGGPDLDPGLGPQQQQQPMAMERGCGGHPIAEAIEVAVAAGGGQEGWAPAARSHHLYGGPSLNWQVGGWVGGYIVGADVMQVLIFA